MERNIDVRSIQLEQITTNSRAVSFVSSAETCTWNDNN